MTSLSYDSVTHLTHFGVDSFYPLPSKVFHSALMNRLRLFILTRVEDLLGIC